MAASFGYFLLLFVCSWWREVGTHFSGISNDLQDDAGIDSARRVGK